MIEKKKKDKNDQKVEQRDEEKFYPILKKNRYMYFSLNKNIKEYISHVKKKKKKRIQKEKKRKMKKKIIHLSSYNR